MQIRTKKKVKNSYKKSVIKGGSKSIRNETSIFNNNNGYNSPKTVSISEELDNESGIQSNNEFNNQNNNQNNISNKIIEQKEITTSNENELNKETEEHEGNYHFHDDENIVINQPYGDEVRVTLSKDEVIYGLNMNVITFDSTIKETKTFTPRSKMAGEEIFIKKYKASENGTIIFDYDKNDPSNFVKQSIVIVPLDSEKNTFVIRNPKNIIAYTGNISIHLEFHTTGLRSSKENFKFTKLKLNKKSDIGYIYLVIDNYEIIEENSNNVKIKNEHFICAALPNNGLKLEKLILPSIRFKSTKEYIVVQAPSIIYRTSNNFSPKQMMFLEKFKTNLIV